MPVFALLAPNRGLHRIEDPRVGGSIHPGAMLCFTISVFIGRHPHPALADQLLLASLFG